MKKILIIFLFMALLLSAKSIKGSVLGKECLLPMSNCGLYGYQRFGYAWPVSASPYIMDCGPVQGEPWAGFEQKHPNGCMGISLSNQTAYIIDSGGWGALIYFGWTIEFGGAGYTIPMQGSGQFYVDCWTAGNGCWEY